MFSAAELRVSCRPNWRRCLLLACTLTLVGCDDDEVADTPDAVAGDVALDADFDAVDGSAGDAEEDGTDADLDVADDAELDVEEDAGTEDATEDADATTEPETPFYLTEWPIPDHEWSRCEGTEHATPGTLAERAAYYQWTVPLFHRGYATLDDGREIVHALFHMTRLDGPVPAEITDGPVPQVVRFESWANAGLWTSHYVASQGFRYAVAEREGDAEELADALHELTVVLQAEYDLMRITGVPGLFARSYHSPTPVTDDAAPDGGDEHYIAEGEFAGYTWTGDVSQDEYSGHMYALGVVAKLVHEPTIQAMVQDIASQVGRHLVENDLHLIDVDGEVTQHGRMNAISFTHFPGYNAYLSLNWVQMTAQITGDPEIEDYYENCLLQQGGEVRCIDHPAETPRPYTEYLDTLNVLQGCDTNFNSLSMAVLAAGNIVWFEGDEALRATYQRILMEKIAGGDPAGRQPFAMANPLYNLIFAAFGDFSHPDAPDIDALVHDAVCTLREFEPTGGRRGMDTTYEPEVCVSEQHGSLADRPFAWREREADIFKFWFGPYERRQTSPDPTFVTPPADFLLPYWMGRYFGFIAADL